MLYGVLYRQGGGDGGGGSGGDLEGREGDDGGGGASPCGRRVSLECVGFFWAG